MSAFLLSWIKNIPNAYYAMNLLLHILPSFITPTHNYIFLYILVLTLILMTPKMINLCHQYRATELGQPAHPYSLTRPYTVDWTASSLDIPKNDFQKWKVYYCI